MPSFVTDRLEAPSTTRAERATDLARARAADRLAGRTVWCATALPAGRGAAGALRRCLAADGCVAAQQLDVDAGEPLREIAERLDVALRLAGALASPARTAGPAPLGRREHAMYDEGASDGGWLAGDEIAPGDVVVLHDAAVAALGDAVRERGAHAVWDLPTGAVHVAVAAAWEFLRPHASAMDALVIGWSEPVGGTRRVEAIAAAMPSAGLVATKEIAAAGDDAEPLYNRGWSSLLADIVDRDRGECVGGTLHARPAVPAR
jgi:hypothetical protein